MGAMQVGAGVSAAKVAKAIPWKNQDKDMFRKRRAGWEKAMDGGNILGKSVQRVAKKLKKFKKTPVKKLVKEAKKEKGNSLKEYPGQYSYDTAWEHMNVMKIKARKAEEEHPATGPAIKEAKEKCAMVQLHSQVKCGKIYCGIGEAKGCGGFCPKDRRTGEYNKIMIVPVFGHKKFYQPSEVYMKNYEKAMEKKRKKERIAKRQLVLNRQKAERKRLELRVKQMEKPAKKERANKKRHERGHKEKKRKAA